MSRAKTLPVTMLRGPVRLDSVQGSRQNLVFELEVQGEPVPKARARARRGQRAFTPARTRQATDQLTWEIVGALERSPALTFKGPLRLELEFDRASRRRCDLDNLAKLVMDAGIGVLWDDDSQIVELELAKREDRRRPRTVIRLYTVSTPLEDGT
jgi:Holliday junction resolvase RusA-like endonuclease